MERAPDRVGRTAGTGQSGCGGHPCGAGDRAGGATPVRTHPLVAAAGRHPRGHPGRHDSGARLLRSLGFGAGPAVSAARFVERLGGVLPAASHPPIPAGMGLNCPRSGLGHSCPTAHRTGFDPLDCGPRRGHPPRRRRAHGGAGAGGLVQQSTVVTALGDHLLPAAAHLRPGGEAQRLAQDRRRDPAGPWRATRWHAVAPGGPGLPDPVPRRCGARHPGRQHPPLGAERHPAPGRGGARRRLCVHAAALAHVGSRPCRTRAPARGRRLGGHRGAFHPHGPASARSPGCAVAGEHLVQPLSRARAAGRESAPRRPRHGKLLGPVRAGGAVESRTGPRLLPAG